MTDIEKFVEKRPEVVAAYGYGSGVFKQAGYTKKDKTQIDLIFVVEDLKKWHKENIKLNRKDYSFTGKVFFKFAPVSKLKGNTGITYLSNIKENGAVYKYGTIEEKDLLEYLETWSSLYLPGRLQKTIYPIKETEELKEKIEINREKALLLAAYLVEENETTKKDLLVTLCGLSYMGDTRMTHFEHPRKVLNIVEGSFDTFDKLYKFDKKYFKFKKDKIIIDKDLVEEELSTLPSSLYEYIKDYLDKPDYVIKKRIEQYFTDANHNESKKQTFKGVATNGIVRSIKYAFQKVKKSFKK